MRRPHLIILGEKNHAAGRCAKDQRLVTRPYDYFRIADHPGVIVSRLESVRKWVTPTDNALSVLSAAGGG